MRNMYALPANPINLAQLDIKPNIPLLFLRLTEKYISGGKG